MRSRLAHSAPVFISSTESPARPLRASPWGRPHAPGATYLLPGKIMDEWQQKELIEQAADKAVAKTFAMLGVDVTNPAHIEDFRMDLRFSRRMRTAMDRGWLAFATAAGLAVAAALWAGIVGKINP